LIKRTGGAHWRFLHDLHFRAPSPNAIVAPIHAKAMPVILTNRRRARCVDARGHGTKPGHCSGPLRDDALKIVARGFDNADVAVA
jgi:hypothetical protein